MKNVSIVVSHPIQHFTPLYRGLARCADINLRVIYASTMGIADYFDPDLNQQVRWSGDLLDGYGSIFLPNADKRNKTTFFAMDSPEIVGVLEKQAPDVLIGYGYSQLLQIRAFRWAHQSGTKYLMISDTNNVTQRPYWKTVVRNAILTRYFRSVDGFLSPGDQNIESLLRLGVTKERIFRSPFTIDEAAIAASVSRRDRLREELFQQFSIPIGSFVCLAVGKLIDRKKPQDLIEAARIAARKNKDIYLLLCGSGPSRARLEQLAPSDSTNIRFAGFINIDRLPDFYAAADLLLHLPAQDPHPLVCTEAAAAGLPMVLSDAVGAIGDADVARNGLNCICVPVSDVNKAAAAILDIANSPERKHQMSKNSLQFFSENNMETAINGTLTAIKTVAE